MSHGVRFRLLFFILVLLALLAALLNCGHYERKYNGDPVGSGDDAGGGSAADDDTGGGGGLIDGKKPLKNFTWMNDAGETVHLYDLKGSVVLLNVGAGWCAPCREEAPHLQSEIYEKFKDQGVMIVELLVEDTDGNSLSHNNDQELTRSLQFLQKWRKEFGLTYWVCADPDWSLINFFPDPTSPVLPLAVFLDKNLVPRYTSNGYEKDEYIYMIESLL